MNPQAATQFLTVPTPTPTMIISGVVALGILLSTIAMVYMQPELSLGILMAFALADMVLYVVMRDCLVCYRCHARYRRVPNLEQVGTFDLEVNERYRQEAIRLKQAEQSAGQR